MKYLLIPLIIAVLISLWYGVGRKPYCKWCKQDVLHIGCTQYQKARGISWDGKYRNMLGMEMEVSKRVYKKSVREGWR